MSIGSCPPRTARSRVASLTRRSNARLVPWGSVTAGLTDRARNARLPRPFFERSTSFPRTGVRSTLRHTMIGGVLYKMAQLYCGEIVYSHVHQYLKDNAPDALYSSDRYDLDLTNHLQVMLGAVPPIEAGSLEHGKTPTDFATILHVGWAVLLTKFGRSSSQNK